MPLISKDDRERLQSTFDEELQGNVALTLSVGKAGQSHELARELMREVASLSSKTSLEVVESDVDAPTIDLTGRLKGTVRFVGLPLGYELPVFIDAIKRSSTGRSELPMKSRERLAVLDSARRILVFTTPD